MRRLVAAALLLLIGSPASPQSSLPLMRKLGELDLGFIDFTATLDPLNPVVPKSTPTAFRVGVSTGTRILSSDDALALLGSGIAVEGVLSGPGLPSPIVLPLADAPLQEDPLLLPIPALERAGDYTLANIRIVKNGVTVLDVMPASVPLKVVDQILITSVKTRVLSLAEILNIGVDLDKDAFLGFEFTLGVKVESDTVQLSMPVVFDAHGVAVPLPNQPPPPPTVSGLTLPNFVPVLMGMGTPEGTFDGLPRMLEGATTRPITIPAILVFPGHAGALRQFFSAQLFVANGAPLGANLTVRDIKGTIHFPLGQQGLGYPSIKGEPQPLTKDVRGVGVDGEPGTADDVVALPPGAQGQAEFILRGDREGFHTVDFGIDATLEGLPSGPVHLKGKASGGVLVRNASFATTFTVPSVVRAKEEFDLRVTLTNTSLSDANMVRVELDEELSGATLVSAPSDISTIAAGDAKTVTFRLKSTVTGKITATYLDMTGEASSGGKIRFSVGVGERGIPLSPDTLVLPTSLRGLPSDVVDAAMRVLGQAWSIANAPPGTLPARVKRTSKSVVTQKALLLAEAGLRMDLGETQPDAVRDLLLDFYGGATIDPGFDQLLRETSAGHELAAVLGSYLGQLTGAAAFKEAMAPLAASGPDFLAIAVEGAPGVLTLKDAAGLTLTRAAAEEKHEIPAGVFVPFGPDALGLVLKPSSPSYTLELAGGATVSLDAPRGDGSFNRFTARFNGPGRLTWSASEPDVVTREEGAVVERLPAIAAVSSSGPQLVSAHVIGPETFDTASTHGQNVAVLFDRVVSAESASRLASYAVPKNTFIGVRRQLSGRLVFGTFAQPEGRFVPTHLRVSEIADGRGVTRADQEVPLGSRIAATGAVVAGRVLNADGTAVAGAIVNLAVVTCTGPLSGVAEVPTAEDGRYEFRYVPREPFCAFQVTARDSDTGSLRRISDRIRYDGEHIAADILLFGRGSVGGTVWKNGAPVAGAGVHVLSGTDPQVGGLTKTDADGRYRVDGITVGPVSVTAASGISVGRTDGRVDRVGLLASVDVTLVATRVSIAGTVYTFDNGKAAPAPQAQVVYSMHPPGALVPVPVAVTTSDAAGHYALTNLPSGPYVISAALNVRDRVTEQGVAADAEDITKDLTIVLPVTAQLATVSGQVLSSSGSPAADVIVSIDDRGALTGTDGRYTLNGVAIRNGEYRAVYAKTRDGRRRASRFLVVDEPVVSNVGLTLSDTVDVRFVVQDENGVPLADVPVALQCAQPCGCHSTKSGPDGIVEFPAQPPGLTQAFTMRSQPGYLDFAEAAVTAVPGAPAPAGVLRFHGAGSVHGTVLDHLGVGLMGTDVKLTSTLYDRRTCTASEGVSHYVRTKPDGTFQFKNVLLGRVSVSATQDFYTGDAGARGTLVSPGQDLPFELKFQNTTSGKIAGTVFLPDGVSPAGAGVRVTMDGQLPGVSVETNDAGHYELPAIFPEGTYLLTTRDPRGAGVAREQLFVPRARDLTHDVRLTGKGTVRVRVENGAGETQHLATLRLWETEFPNQVQETQASLTADGIAVFENVHVGPFSLVVSDPFGRGARAQDRVSYPGQVLDVTVRISATGTVRGRFLNRQKKPIPLGVVTLKVGNDVIGRVTSGAAGADVGRFELRYVPAAGFKLEATDPLTGRVGVALGRIDFDGQVVDGLDVVAQGLGSVRGQVTRNDAPASNAVVTVASGAQSIATRSDDGGAYFVDGVPEGLITVTASLDGGTLAGSAEGELLGDGSATTIDVALQASSAVRGRVKAAVGDDGVPASVFLRVRGLGVGAVTTSPDGRFEFPRVAPGPATIEATALGNADNKGKAAFDVPTSGDVDVRLNGLADVDVFVQTSLGAKVSGAHVYVNNKFAISDDASGQARYRDVPAGPIALRAQAPNGVWSATVVKQLPPGTPATFTLKFPSAGSVTGVVRRFDGTLVGAGVNVSSVWRSTKTAADGSYRLEGVALGNFEVTAKDGPIDTGSTKGKLLVDGGTVTADIQLIGVGGLVVTVEDAGSVPAPGAWVSADGASAIAGDGGLATLGPLLAGANRVQAYDPTRRIGGNTAVTVVAGQLETPVTVSLEPTGVVRGRILAPNGEPFAGASVRIDGDRTRAVLSADDGAYEIANVTFGNHTVTAVVDERTRAGAPVALDAAHDKVIQDLTLIGLGTVRGTVTHGDGSPAAGIELALKSDSAFAGSVPQAAVTQLDGTYGIGGVFAAPFTIDASSPDTNEIARGLGVVTGDGAIVGLDLELLANSVRVPIVLRDANDRESQVKPDGSSLGYDNVADGPTLRVIRGGVASTFEGSGDTGVFDEGGREIVVRQEGLAGLDVTRKVYVPQDGYFARHVDTLTNNGAEPVTVDVVATVAFPPGRTVVATSSGDAVVDASDRWLVLDDADHRDVVDVLNPTPLALVLADAAGQAPEIAVEAGSGGSSFVTYRWNAVTIRAGGSVRFLQAFSKQSDLARAAATAGRLGQQPPELLRGLDPDEAADIVNFAVPSTLTSALGPLPANDGTARVRPLGADGETPVPSAYVRVRSRSRHFWKERTAAGAFAEGAFAVNGLPREAFDVTATTTVFQQTQAASAEGAFGIEGLRDLSAMSGRVLRPSSSSRPAERAVDGLQSTSFAWRQGDAAAPPYYRTPTFDIELPQPVTVHVIRFRGAPAAGPVTDLATRNLRRAGFELCNAAGTVLWSTERDLPEPYGDVDIAVPAVADVRVVRLLDLLDRTDTPEFGDLAVFGEGLLEPSRREEVAVTFAGRGVLEGKVRRHDGSVIADAFVRVSNGSVTEFLGLDGYRLPVVAPGTYTVTAELRAGQSRSVTATVEANQKTTADVQFPVLGRFVGTVRSATGALVHLAPVSAVNTADTSLHATAIALNGAYVLPDLPLGSYLASVTVEHARVEREVTLTDAAPVTVDFQLPATAPVRVHVTSNGQHVSGARIVWRSETSVAWIEAGTTGDLGAVTISDVPGPAFRVRAYQPGSTYLYEEAQGTVQEPGELVTVEVVLPPVDTIAGTIAGTAREGSGAPAAHRRIDLFDAAGALVEHLQSDGSGHFTYGLAPAGDLRLRIANGGFSPLDARLTVLAGATASVDLDIPGHLARAADRDLADVDLVGGVPATIQATGSTTLALYDVDGALLIQAPSGFPLNYTPPAAGRYRVRIGPATFYNVTVTQGPSVRPIERPEGSLSGIVRERPLPGTPAADQTVQLALTSSALSMAWQTTTDASGGFHIKHLPKGGYTLTVVDADNVTLGNAAGTLVEGEAAASDVVISPHGSVTVVVKRGTLTLSNIAVEITSSDTEALSADRVRSRTTSSAGVVTTSMPAGTIVATAVDPQDDLPHTATGTLTPHGTLDLTIAFDLHPGTVRGRVRAADNVIGIEGATVALNGVPPATTDANGDYVLDGVLPGTYTLSFSYGAHAVSRAITFGGGTRFENQTLPIAILQGYTSAPPQGYVSTNVDACGLVGGAEQCVSAVSSVAGFYRFVDTPWRDVEVTVRAELPADPAVKDRVTFHAAAAPTTVTLDLNLERRPTATVSGTVVDADGQPVVAGTVRLSDGNGVVHQLTLDGTNEFEFTEVFPGAVIAEARDADGIPGVTAGAAVDESEVVLPIVLVPAATLSGALRDEMGTGGLARTLQVDALEVPSLTGPAPWSRYVDTADDGSGSFTVRGPASRFRVIFHGEPDDYEGLTAAAIEGSVAPTETVSSLLLLRGSHRRQPQTLSGTLGTYCTGEDCGDHQPLFSHYVSSTPVEGFPIVVAPEVGDRQMRSLLVARDGLTVRQLQFVPTSGAFGRTTTLFTNTTGDAMTLDVVSYLGSTCAFAGTASGDPIAGYLRMGTPGVDELGVVWGGAAPAEVSFDEGCPESQPRLNLVHHLTIPPGETQALMLFVIRRFAGDTLAIQIQALSNLTDPEALIGLSADEKATIVNFTVPASTNTIRGTVSDAAVRTLDGWMVQARRGPAVAAMAATHDGGRYELSLPEEGAYTVEVLDSDDVPVARQDVVAPATDVDLTVPLRGTVHVTLVRDGQPAADVAVEIRSDHPAATGEDAVRHRTSNAAGEITTAAPVGTIVARVTEASGVHETSGSLGDGETLELSLELPSAATTGSVHVTVLDDETPVSGAVVQLVLSTGGGPVAQGLADGDGVLTLSDVEPGNYVVAASHPTFNRPGQTLVTITAGQTSDATVHLAPADQTGTLIIEARVDPTDEPAAGAVVEILDDGLSPPWTTSVILDNAGRATVTGLPAGTLGITSNAPYGFGWSDGQIQEGATTVVRFRIGERQWVPLDLTGGDGLPRMLHGEGDVRTSGETGCDPFCGTYAAVQDADFPGMPVVRVLHNGREGAIGTRGMGSLEVTRRAFVPPQGGFVRYLDVVHNPTAEEITASYSLDVAHAAADWTIERTGSTASSSTDAVYTAADDYVITARAGQRVVFVTAAASGAHRNDEVFFGQDETGTGYGPLWTQLHVPPGQTVILMHFVAEAWDADAARQTAESLGTLTDPDALTGLTAQEKAQIVNFAVNP